MNARRAARRRSTPAPTSSRRSPTSCCGRLHERREAPRPRRRRRGALRASSPRGASAPRGRSARVLEAAPRVGGVRAHGARRRLPRRARGGVVPVDGGAPARAAREPRRTRRPSARPARATNAQFLSTRHGLEALPRTPPAFFASGLLSTGAKVRLLRRAARAARAARARRSRSTRSCAAASAAGSPSASCGHDARASTARAPRTSARRTPSRRSPRWSARSAASSAGPGQEEGRRAGQAARATLGSSRRAWRPSRRRSRRRSATDVRHDVDARSRRSRRDGDSVARPSRRRDAASARARSSSRRRRPSRRASWRRSLSKPARRSSRPVRYVPMIVASVGLAPGASRRDPADAFGFLRSPGAPGRILGASFPSASNSAVAPPGHALWNVFLGGGADPDAFLALGRRACAPSSRRTSRRSSDGPVRPDVLRRPPLAPRDPRARDRAPGADGATRRRSSLRTGIRLSGSPRHGRRRPRLRGGGRVGEEPSGPIECAGSRRRVRGHGLPATARPRDRVARGGDRP